MTSTPTIVMPSIVGPILDQASAFLVQLAPYTALIVGILLALVAVEFLIGAIRHK